MRTTQVAGVMLLGLVLGAPLVRAEAELTHITYSAVQCQQAGTDTGAFDRSPYRITRSGSAGSGTVICPVPFTVSQTFTAVKDSHGQWSRFKWVRADKVKVVVKVNDNHTGNVECRLKRRSFDGTVLGPTGSAHTSDVGTTTLVLTVPVDPTGYNVTDILTLECDMPVNQDYLVTKIFSYDVITTNGPLICEDNDLNRCTAN